MGGKRMESACYVQNPDVILREESDSGALLFNPDTGQVILLNETALFIWGLCDGTRTLADIMAEVAENFDDVPEAQLNSDLMSFVEGLVKSGYLGTEHEFIAREVVLE
jgi:hypothetical protein